MAISRTSNRGRGGKAKAQAKSLYIEAQKARIAELLNEGHLPSECAELMGLARSTISKLRKELHSDHRAHAMEQISDLKARELAKLEHRERIAWQELARSRLLRRTDTGNGEDESSTVQGRCGLDAGGNATRIQTEVADPRWFDVLAQISEQRCALMGLNAPIPVRINTDDFTRPELMRLAAGEPLELVMRARDDRLAAMRAQNDAAIAAAARMMGPAEGSA